MKLKNLALLPLAACAVFGSVASAQTVTFRGTVIENTCIPSIGGQTNATVTLPIVSPSDFPNQNDFTADETTFTIDLTNCSTAATYAVKAYFYQANAVNGRLSKTGGGLGEGWTYQLLSSAGTTLAAGNNATVIKDANDPGTTIVASGPSTGSIDYRVRYYNETGTLTSGTMDALANYVLYVN